jgi:hypothetical protein
MTAKVPAKDGGALLHDVRRLIEEARSAVAITVNAGLTMLYWQIGKRINREILKGEQRADYGEQILATLSQELTAEYGRGFTYSALTRILRLAPSGIRVAEYLTELPPREILEKKLHTAVEHARQRIESRIEIEEKKPIS